MTAAIVIVLVTVLALWLLVRSQNKAAQAVPPAVPRQPLPSNSSAPRGDEPRDLPSSSRPLSLSISVETPLRTPSRPARRLPPPTAPDSPPSPWPHRRAGRPGALFFGWRRWGAGGWAAARGGAVYGFSPAMINSGLGNYHR